MPARETIKTLLLQRCMTITELAKKLTELTGKNILVLLFLQNFQEIL